MTPILEFHDAVKTYGSGPLEVRALTGVPTHRPDLTNAGAFCFVSEATRQRAERKALFCLATGVQPSEYEALNGFELEAFIDLVNSRSQ